MSQPLVSIVTPVLNRAGYLPRAVSSLQRQDYPKVQHVVVDGGSSDGTVDFLKQHPEIEWESINGLGQAAALNRALDRCEGELIGWLNSDDEYLPGALTAAVKMMSCEPTYDLLYGDCVFIDEDGTVLRRWHGRPFGVRRLVWYDAAIFSVQSTFFRRHVYQTVGAFDTSLQYALDYDWMIRVGLRCRVKYVPVELGAFRRHEFATQGKEHRAAYNAEVYRVSKRWGGHWPAPVKYRLFASLPHGEQIVAAASRMRHQLLVRGLVPRWLRGL